MKPQAAGVGALAAGIVLFIFWAGGVDLDKRDPILSLVLFIMLVVGVGCYAAVQEEYKK